MNPRMRCTAATCIASVQLVTLTACGSLLPGGESPSSPAARKGDDVTIGLLLPEKDTARYEKFDRPIIEQQVKELTGGQGRVVYANADQDAKRQSSQMRSMVDDKVDTILVDPVDAHAIAPSVRAAKAAGVHVIAYDRLAEGPIDAYIGFDNELVGEVQGKAILDALGDDATKKSKVVMVNGSPTDPNSAQYKEGARSRLALTVTIAKSYATAGWKPENAKAHMERAISDLGVENIAAVYSANDGMAGGIVQALKEAGVTELPPVTGQDAELAAVRRILTGDQYMSVYKPYTEEAATAAEMAVRISQGRNIEFEAMTADRVDSPTAKDVRAHTVVVEPMTRKNIESTVVKDGIFKVSDICTPKYAVACAEAGLTED
ncbi:sugar ABC transporter substrate-binding protein [Streptomyces cavernicola]|uniref:Substrate-binding domain-containing protein n=1 Tax=Streptomyces cavernicola TaxID=3043613 RepID=A0ABT6SCK4_9ACTN|nr:substrate-binding domain-containing protein [Streptomyces sp. B-S-A6]MDI3405203.1 substrate-binding domain-containing protein [Streptomyces sp. B-S-A6]